MQFGFHLIHDPLDFWVHLMISANIQSSAPPATGSCLRAAHELVDNPTQGVRVNRPEKHFVSACR